jgi:hypothetical protein
MPGLVTTDPAYNKFSLKNPSVVKGTFRPGDRFYLATDALAEYFVSAWESNEGSSFPFDFSDEHEFQSWIDDLRVAKSIRNDDVTLLIVEAPNDRRDQSLFAHPPSHIDPILDTPRAELLDAHPHQIRRRPSRQWNDAERQE